MSCTTVIDEVSFDTNILIYSIDLRDKPKHEACRRIVRRCSDAGAFIALQCLAEFYRACTRKQLLPQSIAQAVVDQARAAMKVVPHSEPDLEKAMLLHQAYGTSFFDAMIVSALLRAGCRTLISEDFQHGQSIAGLTVLNPFRLSEAELDALLAV